MFKSVRSAQQHPFLQKRHPATQQTRTYCGLKITRKMGVRARYAARTLHLYAFAGEHCGPLHVLDHVSHAGAMPTSPSWAGPGRRTRCGGRRLRPRHPAAAGNPPAPATLCGRRTDAVPAAAAWPDTPPAAGLAPSLPPAAPAASRCAVPAPQICDAVLAVTTYQWTWGGLQHSGEFIHRML